ncbi:MAG: ABC transporter permease [Melioribacteraceae bacterium]|nr:ABC transporter permease [Melioribacteraceae bacterium]
MIEYYIARKYLKAKHKINFVKILSTISIVGITIGVAALIIVLSVFNGFGSIVTNILVSFDPHVKIISTNKNLTEKDFNIILDKTKNHSNIKSITKIAEAKALFINDKTYEVVNLVGVETVYTKNDESIKSKIISGKYDLSNNNIILGLALALRLGVRVGDEVVITSAYNIEKTIINFTLPQTNKFIVSGIFESDNRDYDVGYAFTSLQSAQKLFGLNNEINSIEFRLVDFHDSEDFKNEISKKINNDLTVQTWYDLHKELYNVMLIERWSAYIILCLIIAVATFNIFASLTMTVIEKKRDIGILRALGLNENSIKKIFLMNGFFSGLIGTFLGLFLGLFVCYLQINYKIYPLDPMKYIIDAIPIQIRVTDILAISFMSIFLSSIAAYFPSKRATKINLIESIKYE